MIAIVLRAVLIVLLMAGAAVAEGTGPSSSSASSSSSSADGRIDARIGGLALASGARIAFEFVQDRSIDCFASPSTVHTLQLLNDDGALIRETAVEPAAPVANWWGKLQLVGGEDAPLPTGSYALSVGTSVGTFTVEFDIVPVSAFAGLGRSTASASVCGLSLRVYRLLTEDDPGAEAVLRIGDRLMVALTGNPTTGYTWENTATDGAAVLRPIGETTFRPESDLPGAGGVVVFRYEAIARGVQPFRFVYHRPWESVEPLEVIEYMVTVF